MHQSSTRLKSKLFSFIRTPTPFTSDQRNFTFSFLQLNCWILKHNERKNSAHSKVGGVYGNMWAAKDNQKWTTLMVACVLWRITQRLLQTRALWCDMTKANRTYYNQWCCVHWMGCGTTQHDKCSTVNWDPVLFLCTSLWTPRTLTTSDVKKEWIYKGHSNPNLKWSARNMCICERTESYSKGWIIDWVGGANAQWPKKP